MIQPKDAERLKEKLKRDVDHGSRMYENLYNDILEYLTSKCPDMKTHEVKEFSGFIVNRVNILVADVIWERDKMWQNYLTKNKTIRERKNDQT